MTRPDLGLALLKIARNAIAERLGLCGLAEADDEALQQRCATFVTLRRSGKVRGCIGSLQAVRALGVDVRENAIAAAFRDPRFEPLDVAEFEATSVEVSLLSAGRRIAAADEGELVARLRPGLDGLILEYAGCRATLLPQAWEALSDPREFLAALKLKAGLPRDFWSPHLSVSGYTVTRWAEGDFMPGEARV